MTKIIKQDSRFRFVKKKDPPHAEDSIQIIGWCCTLEVREKDELFGLGFTRNEESWPTYEKPRKIKRLFRTDALEHGFIVTSLLNAAKSCSELRKWRLKHGVEEPLMKIDEYAKSFAYALKASPRHPNEIWNEFAREAQGIWISGFNESYKMTADSIFPIIAYEVLELFRKGKTFQWCPCGKLYVTRPRQRTNHCAGCKEPSRMPTRLLPENKLTERRRATLKRVKEYQERQRRKAGLSEKEREQLRNEMDQIIKGKL